MMEQSHGSQIMIWSVLLFSLLVLGQVLPPFSSLVHADSELSAWASVPPTIDGVVDVAEWASASSVAYTTTGGVSGVFYVMNDAVNLYTAVVTIDANLSVGSVGYDSVLLYFDNDHDGVGPESGDDYFGWNGHLSEGFLDGFQAPGLSGRDEAFGGSSDGGAAATNNLTHNQFEIMHPLNTVDDAHDFSLSVSSTVGFAIKLTVDGYDEGWWPSSDQSLWGDISIFRPVLSAWASTTPLIDGKLHPSFFLLNTYVPAEWEDADKMDFVLSWGGESHNASLYVKNDYVNLYLAFEIKNEDYQDNDVVMFNFDNNHDGMKAIGDDQLLVEGWNFFQDAYFPTLEGPSQWDVLYTGAGGGSNDGVGAAQFTWQTSVSGSYVFEVAHPLNTVDNAHDFSLEVGDSRLETVGFNVLYLDSGGVVGYDGWPTSTQNDWSQMADIEITGPPLPPPASDVNLKIRKIEITQGIQWFDEPLWRGVEDNSVPLARGKSTVVRVYVDIGYPFFPVSGVDVYLYATDGVSGMSLADPGMFGSYGPLRASFEAPGFPDRGNVDDTANFLLPDYWVTSESLTLTAFVKAPDGQMETDYTDNWMSHQTFSFTLTKSLRIGYYRIDYRPTAPDENANLPSDMILDGYTWFEKVAPLPDLSDPIDYYPMGTLTWDSIVDNEANVDNTHALIKTLNEIYTFFLLFGLEVPDKIYGWLPDDVPNWGGHADMSLWPHAGGLDVVAIGDESKTIFAHEVIHTLRRQHAPDAPSPDPDWPYSNAQIQTYGFDTQLFEVLDPTTTFDVMSYYSPRWITPYTYNACMHELDPPAGLSLNGDGQISDIDPKIDQMPEKLVIHGVVYHNNTGSLDPMFKLSSVNGLTPNSGPYTVELRGAPPSEPLLYSQNFSLWFANEEVDGSLDRAYFMLTVPFMTGTESVSLWNGTVLLDKITASASAPEVTVTSPNGRETVGDSFNVTWTASDADGDPLTFNLFYSSDGGRTWRPLATGMKGDFSRDPYRVDASVLPGGSQSLIRVLASDGFHTSEDQSNAEFNVPLKGPQDLVVIILGGTPNPRRRDFYFGDPIGFKGSGFDPEDGVLSDTAFTWTSDLNGTLGTGRVLPVTDLTPGTHNITLTAIDSHGNNTTHSFTVTVALRSQTLLGDLNYDGVVDIFDVVILANAFGSTPGDPNWNQTADLNNDDVVDIFDVVLLAQNFGKTA